MSMLECVLGGEVFVLLLRVGIIHFLDGDVVLDEGIGSTLLQRLNLSLEEVVLADEHFLEGLLLALMFFDLNSVS